MLATHREEVQLVAGHLLPYIRLLLGDKQLSSISGLDRAIISEALRGLGAADNMQWLL